MTMRNRIIELLKGNWAFFPLAIIGTIGVAYLADLNATYGLTSQNVRISESGHVSLTLHKSVATVQDVLLWIDDHGAKRCSHVLLLRPANADIDFDCPEAAGISDAKLGYMWFGIGITPRKGTLRIGEIPT